MGEPQATVGFLVFTTVGALEEGLTVGFLVGFVEGALDIDGAAVGGLRVGEAVGTRVGRRDGAAEEGRAVDGFVVGE